MAKAARQLEDISKSLIDGITQEVFNQQEEIASARGSFMATAKGHREQIRTVLERAATNHGIPQRVMKLKLEIESLQLRIKGKIADLEGEQQKLLQKITKTQGDKAQLALFSDIPKSTRQPKPAKEARPRRGRQNKLALVESASPAA